MIFDARSSSRRWMTVHHGGELGEEERLLDRGVSPPPTMARAAFWRKKKPSQVAQVDTP